MRPSILLRVGLVWWWAWPAQAQPRELQSWDEAVTVFARHSADTRVAAQEVVRASGRRRAALGPLLPQLSGSAMASFSLLPPPPGEATTAALFGAAPYQTMGLVVQLAAIDLRAWNALAAAVEAEDATRLSQADAQRLLLLNLAQSLLNVVAAQKLAELNASGVLDAEARLGLALKSERAGAATALDVGRLRQDLAAAKTQVVTSDEAAQQAREALGLALGLEEPVGVAPTFVLDGLVARVPERCRAVAQLDLRPDVKAAAASVEVAHRGVLDVSSQFLPTIALRSNVQAFVISGSVFPIWNLQAVLSVPLWDGGSRYGALREAKAQEVQAQARSEVTQRSARVEVSRARRSIEVAARSLALAQEALVEAEKTDELTRRAYEGGAGTSLELVTAASAVRAQRLAFALRDYDVLRARVAALFSLMECTP